MSARTPGPLLSPDAHAATATAAVPGEPMRAIMQIELHAMSTPVRRLPFATCHLPGGTAPLTAVGSLGREGCVGLALSGILTRRAFTRSHSAKAMAPPAVSFRPPGMAMSRALLSGMMCVKPTSGNAAARAVAWAQALLALAPKPGQGLVLRVDASWLSAAGSPPFLGETAIGVLAWTLATVEAAVRIPGKIPSFTECFAEVGGGLRRTPRD